MLNELQFQTGYTSDPRFSSPEPAPTSEPVAAVSAVPATRSDPEPGDDAGNPAVSVFLALAPKDNTRFGKVTVTDLYGTRDGKHDGIDLSAQQGTPIYAALDGTVDFAGKDMRVGVTRIYNPDGDAGPNGNYVKIKHGDGTLTFYLHLDTVNTATGKSVSAGDQIGTMGNTGRVMGTTGIHLHFQTYDNSNTVIDPLVWMKDHPTAIFPVEVG